MTAYLLLPFSFLTFWYLDAPKRIAAYFLSLNQAFFQAFSLPLLLRTFFRPLKNEYRSGLVGFSIGMGIVVKTVLILIDLVFFLVLLAGEALLFVGFLAAPLGAVAVLFL